MSLTKEMIMRVESDIEKFTNEELLNYNSSYTMLNKHYPNSYYMFMVDRSRQEIVRRGLDNINL